MVWCVHFRKFKGNIYRRNYNGNLKVSAKTNPNSVAGALAGVLREKKGGAEIQAIGAGALNQAVKPVNCNRKGICGTKRYWSGMGLAFTDIHRLMERRKLERRSNWSLNQDSTGNKKYTHKKKTPGCGLQNLFIRRRSFMMTGEFWMSKATKYQRGSVGLKGRKIKWNFRLNFGYKLSEIVQKLDFATFRKI